MTETEDERLSREACEAEEREIQVKLDAVRTAVGVLEDMLGIELSACDFGAVTVEDLLEMREDADEEAGGPTGGGKAGQPSTPG